MNDNIIVAVTQCAERLGWTVQTDIPKENNVVIFEFYKFSPAGQDFGFSVGMEGNELANLVGNMEDYYNASMPTRKRICGSTTMGTERMAHPTT